MQQEAADELIRGERHGFVTVTFLRPVVLPLEGDALFVHCDQPAVGDGDPMGIAGEIGQYSVRSGKGTFGVDNPVDLAQGLEPISKHLCLSKRLMFTEELQFAGTVGVAELLEEQAPEQSREHTHGQEKPWPAGDPTLAVKREAPAGDDAVHMGMMGHGRAPGVQHQGCADAGAQVFWIGRNRAQSLGSGLEQEAVDYRLVVPGDVADGCWQGEDQVIVIHGQEVGLTGLEPAPGRSGLALRTMAVTAGVIGDLRLLTGRALQHVTAQRRTAALFDGRHDLELAEAEVSGLRTTPRRPVGAEDIRDLQVGARHARGLRRAVSTTPVD